MWLLWQRSRKQCWPLVRGVPRLCGGHQKPTEEVDSIQLNQETRPELQWISALTLTIHTKPESTEFQMRALVFTPGAPQSQI